ncbi:MAG TPA: Mur ligase family protein [Acidimicrobiia bacterium]|nr:Mur ligase family protein [Acidimicrobiia bacterium]
MQPGEARAWLDAHVNLETGVGAPSGPSRRATAPTLERISLLVELLGSPQLSYPVIHVTGTNGKTSVARMTAALVESTGLSVGSFTSPHLAVVNERIVRNGEPIADSELDALLAHIAPLEPVLAEHGLDRVSWFEILTAAALTWFADVAVDVAVIEVGLGGTWDSTNIVAADVAVVTNVSIDHVDYLGSTRADIAAEKAGIVDPSCTLVLGETDTDLVAIFAGREPDRIVLRDRDFGIARDRVAHGGRLVDVRTPLASYDDVFLPLHGAYQSHNVAVAITAAESFLERPLDADGLRATCAELTSPGRLEVVGHRPLVLLDGAHNVAGAHALAAALAEEFPDADRALVVGLLREKDAREMLDALGARSAALVVCCRPPSPRGLDAVDLGAEAIEMGIDRERVVAVDSVPEAVARAIAATPADGQVVVAGSLYVVGAARSALVPASSV